MQAVLPRLRAANDDPERVRGYLDEAGVFPSVASLKASVVGDVRATLWILLGTVGVVLLIAVANVANLFLVRSQESQRESAVRAALGAGRLRLAREFLAETGLLAGSACALGLGAAWVAVAVLRERAPVNIPRLDEVRLDAVSVGVSAVVCLLTALLLGIVPALGRRTRDMAATLKDASGRATAGPHRVRGLSLLVTTQVALALVLLVGSGLLFRTFQALRAVDLGFSERDALTFQVGLPPAAYDRVAAIRFHDALLERLAALPGVESAAIVGQCLPLSGDMCWGETLEVEGRPAPAGEMPKVTGVRVVSPGYFGTLGIPVRGRGIEAEDVRSGAPGAVLSESAAHAYFPGEDPIGRRLSFGDDPVWFTVVGVAGDVRSRVATDEFTSLIYLPVRADVTDGPPPHNVAYAVTTTLPPASIASAVRAAVAEADPDVPLGDVRALADLIDSATAPTAFTLALVGLAALLSLVLGTVGVYAVVAYSVSRRTPEIGVRMALGARASDVRRMVVRQGGAAVVVGAAAGLAGAFALTRLIESMLFGVSATDPLTYAAVTALMLAVAAAAMWLPARRAARVDPVRALRSE
jgi:predicted permease